MRAPYRLSSRESCRRRGLSILNVPYLFSSLRSYARFPVRGVMIGLQMLKQRVPRLLVVPFRVRPVGELVFVLLHGCHNLVFFVLFAEAAMDVPYGASPRFFVLVFLRVRLLFNFLPVAADFHTAP